MKLNSTRFDIISDLENVWKTMKLYAWFIKFVGERNYEKIINLI